jgi:hypothetical protein
MTTFNLITLTNGQTAGVEPLIAETAELATAYAAGMITERVKGHEDMFMSPRVRWAIDTGVVDLVNVTMLTGDVVGTFDLVQRDGAAKLVWSLP